MTSTILLLLLNAQVPNAAHMATLIQQVAQAENVDPITVTKIVIVESRGNPHAINWKTGDYGVMQVNLKSHPKVSLQCALNLECGLRAGARILKATKRPCAFNVGNAKLKGVRLKNCLIYDNKLASINFGG